LGALNNHEGRLDTEEINVDNLQGDVGAWSVYEGLMEGNSWDEDNITAAIINIRNRQDDLTADFVDVTGDIMTGSLTFSNDSSTGVFGTTTLNIGASSQTYITVTKDGDNDWGDIEITGNASVSKNLTVTGDLLVSGETTTINTETVTIEDNIIILNSNATSTPSEDAGFEIERGDTTNSSFLWIEDGDYWEASDQFRVDNLKFDGNTISSINTNTIEITPSGTGIIDLNANKLDISDCIIIVDTRLNDGQLYIGQDGGNVTRTTLTEGEGINIANATGSITISAEVSTLENAGIAKFSSDNFLVSSGEVTIKDDGIILGTETTGYYVKDGVTSGLGISGEVDSEGGTFTVTSDATADNTASTIVYRDGTKNFKVSSIEVDEIKSVTSGGNLKLSGDGDGIVEVTDELKVSGDATITGDLTVSGTTTTTNTETVQIQDNIMLLNIDAEYPPLENSGIEIYRDAPDINITDTEFTSGTDYTIVSLGDTTQVQWNTAAGTSGITYVVDDTFTASGTGVGTGTVNLSADRNKKFLWDEGNDKWTVGSETMVAAIFEGDLTGDVTGDLTGNVTGDLTGNAGTASGWETGRTITLTGDIAGTSESWDGTGNISFAATIQDNSVALGTDTTGNYVGEGAVSGTGLSGSLSAEGGTFTVTSNATDANTASTIVARDSAGRFKITDPTADQDAATKAYVDTKLTASDLDFQGDSGGALSIDLESEILDIAGGTGITSVGSVNTVTLNIDSTVATLTGTQTLTNKSLTSPAITGSISGDAFLDEDDLVSDSATKVASQQSIKAYVDGAAESRQDDIGAMISTKVTASDYVAGDAGITYQIIDPTGTTQTQWEAIGVSGTAVKGLLFTGAAATGTGSGTMAKPATHSIQTNVSVAYDDVNAGISFVTPAELTADITGNAGTATTLETARNIGGVSFNGSANINLPGVNSAGDQNTSGSAATVTGAAQGAITSLGTLTTLTIDDITINGSTISDSGDFTLDIGGDIILDANGGDIFLKDDGTTYGSLTNTSTSGNLIIKSGTTTAATFSGADVTFSGTIAMGANKVTGVGNPTADQDAATKSYVDTEVATAVTSEMSYKGAYNAETNSPNLDDAPTDAIAKGDMYTVTVAGTFFSVPNLEIGDVLIAEVESPTTKAQWTVVSKDLDAASIKTLYEGEDNAFTDEQFSKLGNIANNANDYDLPEANATTKGGIELFSNTVQTTSATAVSDEDLRTYGLQLNSDGQAVVNVPWATPGVSDVIVDGSTVNGRSITINNSGPTTTEGYNNGDVWFEY